MVWQRGCRGAGMFAVLYALSKCIPMGACLRPDGRTNAPAVLVTGAAAVEHTYRDAHAPLLAGIA
jgi:hypothetical protein